jgi:hypothetical protein
MPTFTVEVDLTISIELEIEAATSSEARKIAQTYTLWDRYVTGTVKPDDGARWSTFDATTSVTGITKHR